MSAPAEHARDALALRRYALFDAAGLTSAQREVLDGQGSEGGHHFYADLADAATREAEPLMYEATPECVKVVESLWADPEKRWAASVLSSPLSIGELAQRLGRIRYVNTQDGQRYFFRFADSRCFEAMHRALEPSNRSRLLAGWCEWRACARDGRSIELHGEPDGQALVFALRLSANELDRLLHMLWPDQLLASVHELIPDQRRSQDAALQHDWMQRLCGIFEQFDVEAYPVQIDAAVRVLHSEGQLLDDPAFVSSIARSAKASDAS